jgi:uncharacterized protein (TIRG00374 family)
MPSPVHPPSAPSAPASKARHADPSRAPRTPARQRAGLYLKRHRRTITAGLAIAVIVGFIYVVLPQIAGLSGTLRRLRDAQLSWIGLGVILEVGSLAGYMLLFRTVFSCHENGRVGWRESAQITLAGTVASKVLATAGAGGVALTAWALRAAGLTPRAIARRMIAFEVLLYSVFAGALLLAGAGLRTGLLPGQAPWTLTVVPAVLAGAVIVATLSLRAFPAGLERRIAGWRGSTGRGRRLVARISTAPRTVRDATGIALELVRSQLGVLGAVADWGLDSAALWASLHAFGAPPPFAAIVMAYFIGQLANVIPLPGGIGGVEGGMIGALIAFGAQGSLAILGVLAYRLISFWLPTIPGAIAYVRLRGTVARWRKTEPPAPAS